MSSIEMIHAAASRAKGVVRRTPLLSSPFLDEIAGRRIFVKAECLQHTGSFKFRGAWSALSGMAANERAKGVLAFSSGNHAQGVALAAKMHKVPAVIIMPSDAPRQKIDNTRALGAEVVLYDRAGEDRNALGENLQKQRGLVLVKPFDNAFVIAGQGTTGLEIAKQANLQGIEKAQVLVPCGGGGLTAGIALALNENAPEMTVRPCEPVGFDDTIRSLKSGAIEENAQKSGSICDAIITPSPGKMTFPIMRSLCQPGVAVRESECLKTMQHAFARLKIVVEPGAAVALATALFHSDTLPEGDIIAVVSGGNVDAEMFQRALDISI
ncbi:MAG: threonine/serine dehydratase [Alphaproteobacteria bacterium]|nr:threonine/serine dehydratase [Alphaproteobacteria bacterium]